MSLYTRKTDAGSIMLSKAVVGNIIINAVDKLDGKAVLCNSKGKSAYSEQKNMTFMELETKDNELYIKIYVLMKFGAGVSHITSTIIDSVKKDMKTALGGEPRSVSLIIKGVFSKNTVKRNIEIRK